MRIVRDADRRNSPSQEVKGKFTGIARSHPLHQSDEPAGIAFIHFATGARNHWHTHSGGQVLHIVEGTAQLQSWGEEVVELSPGDTAVAAPGEKHWHGAGPGGPMTHLAVTSGQVVWDEDETTA